MKHNKIWLVGAGPMAVAYARVLNDIGVDLEVIGNGAVSAAAFKRETGQPVTQGGIEKFLEFNPPLPDAAIIAVHIAGLAEVCKRVLHYGVKEILLEKPGVDHASEIDDLVRITREQKANVLLAYNRRFFASVQKAKEMIEKDGGVTSFNFEFTEWSHVIAELGGPPDKRFNWFLGNSTHVIDTAFYLGGKPVEICTFVKGKGRLGWHPASSNYAGAGETDKGALFSYHANWEAPGRWAMEILTNKHRYVFKPMEKLQIQELGSVAVNPVHDIDYSQDEKFKPGLYRQAEVFLTGEYNEFCDIYEQEAAIAIYKSMSDY